MVFRKRFKDMVSKLAMVHKSADYFIVGVFIISAEIQL
jgi:hypothetical protein